VNAYAGRMLTHIAMLEGAAERRTREPLDEGLDARARGEMMRAAANVRSELQRARLAETELLRLQGESPMAIASAIDTGLERGRHSEAVDMAMAALSGRDAI
jgi:hypothetical protein